MLLFASRRCSADPLHIGLQAGVCHRNHGAMLCQFVYFNHHVCLAFTGPFAGQDVNQLSNSSDSDIVDAEIVDEGGSDILIIE